MRSSWDNIQLMTSSSSGGGGLHQSTATVNSLHSSSHSSSSNQSSGEAAQPLSYSLGSHSSIPIMERGHTTNVQLAASGSVKLGQGPNLLGDKSNSYSQPYLNNTGEWLHLIMKRVNLKSCNSLANKDQVTHFHLLAFPDISSNLSSGHIVLKWEVMNPRNYSVIQIQTLGRRIASKFGDQIDIGAWFQIWVKLSIWPRLRWELER